MSKKEVPIVVITGYLGSGKTTLMQHILMQEKRKVGLRNIQQEAEMIPAVNGEVDLAAVCIYVALGNMLFGIVMGET